MGKQEAVIVSRSDPGKSRYLFAMLQKKDAVGLVKDYGHKPRFAIMPIKWYKGTAVDDKPHRYELYVGAKYRAKHSPHMSYRCFGNPPRKECSRRALQSKWWVSTRYDWDCQSRRTNNSMMSWRPSPRRNTLKVKDESTGSFVVADDLEDSRVSYPATWNGGESVYLINVPPW